MALYAFDGTSNIDEVDDIEDTNVVRFKELYQGQDVEYIEGVGTRFGTFGKVLGGLFGVGGKPRIEEMQDTLIENWEKGDHTIDVIGFSRGAALAIHFSNQICKDGIELSSGVIKPKIRFLGLWDVVGSFGLALDNIVDFQQINLGWDIDNVAQGVENCFHAMALDERRESFGITRLNEKQDKKNISEMWFRGVHSDVGGGNSNPDRSNIALNWMLENAIASGVKINLTKLRLPKYAQIDVFAKVSENKDITIDAHRKVLPADKIHSSAESIALKVNQTHAFTVNSELRYNWVGVQLQEGCKYHITADKDQTYFDKSIECGPDGWETSELSWYKETLVESFEKARRVPDANWLELIGSYGDAKGQHHSERDHYFRVGSFKEFTADRTASLYMFVNDLYTKYGNNEGSIEVEITRIQ